MASAGPVVPIIWNPPLPFDDLPDEILLKIFELLMGVVVWNADTRRSSPQLLANISYASIDRRTRKIALESLFNRLVLRLDVANLTNISLSPIPFYLMGHVILTHTAAPQHWNLNRVLPSNLRIHFIGPPWPLLPLMPSLKSHCIMIDLGNTHAKNLHIGHILRYRESMGPVFPNMTIITFLHHRIKALNWHRAFQWISRWTFVFDSDKKLVKILRTIESRVRYLQTNIYNRVAGQEMLCLTKGCYKPITNFAKVNTANGHLDYTPGAKVCRVCTLAIYCSDRCRQRDTKLHKNHGCIFGCSPLAIDNFAGPGMSNYGYRVEKLTTGWGRKA